MVIKCQLQFRYSPQPRPSSVAKHKKRRNPVTIYTHATEECKNTLRRQKSGQEWNAIKKKNTKIVRNKEKYIKTTQK